jgi:hypothetical protein
MGFANVNLLEVATVAAAGPESTTTTCCGGPPKADVEACCAKDELAKQSGESGCGCGPARRHAVAKTSCCAIAP